MVKRLYNIIKRLLTFFFLSSNKNDGLLESLVQNITAVYKCPEDFTTKDLFNTSKMYLNELRSLESKMRTNSTNIAEIEKLISKRGIPKHITNVPVRELSRVYDWKEADMDKFMATMMQTHRTWMNIIQFLKEQNSTAKHILDFNVNYIN